MLQNWSQIVKFFISNYSISKSNQVSVEIILFNNTDTTRRQHNSTLGRYNAWVKTN